MMNAFEFNLHETLLIELMDEECFSGELVFRNKTGTQIELANVRNISTNMMVEGIQKFYCQEIVRASRLGAKIEIPVADVLPVQKCLSTSPEPRNSSYLPPDQFKRILTGIDESILIDSTGSEYSKAMQCIRKCDFFAVAFAIEMKATASVVSLISMCTDDHRIIQMDIQSIGRVPSELKIMLESRVPRKVVHNSPVAAYILQANYDIKLNGIFDTLVKCAFWGVAEYYIFLISF